MSNKKYESYKATMRKLADVNYSIAVLSWDKEVYLPTKGATIRSQQVATLSGIAHEIFTDPKLGKTLADLKKTKKGLTRNEAKNVALTHKEYERQKKYSTKFVIKKSEVTSKSYHAWIEARKANDFNIFKGPLKDMIDIVKEEADILGYKNHPYDALLDLYEPDCKTKDLDILFGDVKAQLVDFASKIRDSKQVDDKFMRRKYPKQKQWDFGLDLLKNMGYDFEAGRQDVSEHPFTINFSPQDVRVTTRVDEKDFGNMTWSCIHEGGHALYEQGLPVEQYGLPLGSYISLGIHESQSRLWENNVGRSLPYWKAHYEKLQSTFPRNLKNVSLDDFYKGINKVSPSLIRTESDELHYHFHIMIRYEIEKALMEGSIKVADLRDIWNQKYKEYLGVDVPDDKHGILQDIHWSHGSIGYFPTYSLGSFYAAQFFHQASKDIPRLKQKISQGNNSQLLTWLRENVHQHGRKYTADQLCKKITGESLNVKYFMDYAKKKYKGIYKM